MEIRDKEVLMTDEMSENATIEEVVTRINLFTQKNNLTTTDMARLLNWNRSTLSQFLRGKYQGNNDVLRTRAIEFFNLKIELPETPEEQFVETTQAKKVFTACKFAQKKGLLALIIGPAGVGKTTALEAYTRKMSQSVMVTAYPGIPPNRLYKRLTRKLKYEGIGDDSTLIEMLINRLKGKNVLIIIDEGHYMKINLLEQIRHIQDMTGIGIVISGNFDLYERMKGKEQVKYAHLYSRAAMRVRVQGSPIRNELKSIMEKKGIPTDGQSMEFMYTKVSTPGHFRILRNIAELAAEMASMEKQPISFNHLLEAEKLIMEE
jgi:DNA transposition AAA+ family ATPase